MDTSRLEQAAAGLLLPVVTLGLCVASCSIYDTNLLHTQSTTSGQDAGDDHSVQQQDASEDQGQTLPDQSSEPADDAGPDVEQDVPSEVAPDAVDPYWCEACTDHTLARPPCSGAETPTDAGQVALVFAFRTLRAGMNVDEPNDWQNIGLDLDCMNTGPTGDPTPCKRHAQATPDMVQDGAEGRDNSFGHNFGGLIQLVESWNQSNIEVDNIARMQAGRRGLLISIDNYNGFANDNNVRVALYQANGVFDSTGTVEMTAVWDGTDLWWYDASSASPTGEPLFMDDDAYVVDYTLVGHMPDGTPIRIGGDTSLSVSLNRSTIQFHMSPDLMSVTDGVLTGVWQTAAAVTAIDVLAAQYGICPDNFYYQEARKMLERAPDVRLDLVPKPELDCNGISIAMAFTAGRGLLGSSHPTPPEPPNLCAGDAGPDAQ